MKTTNKNGRDPFKSDAQSLINLVKQHENSVRHETTESWKEIEKIVSQRKKRHSIKYVFAAAAILFLLITLPVYYFPATAPQQEGLSLALLEKNMDFSAVDTIVMITSGQTVWLDNDTELIYANDGSVEMQETAVIKSDGTQNSGQEPAEAWSEVIVPKGKRIALTLSDGTKLKVNSSSRVIYPNKFNKESREILVNGEIYIEVAHEPERPFFVKTNNMQVKVLGTTFNICSYKEDPFSSVVLVEGSVEVETQQTTTLLKPHQMLKYTENNLQVNEVDIHEYTSWINNMLYLQEREIGEVLERLSRYYGRNITYSKEVSLIPLSGKLDLRENLEESIEIICISLDLDYQTDESENIILTLKESPME
ncbi:MAG: FecR domain-containing protein [Tannerellaceae bacterium]|nr:FecR domain-containing protein [Tannerellaceae bacterium]